MCTLRPNGYMDFRIKYILNNIQHSEFHLFIENLGGKQWRCGNFTEFYQNTYRTPAVLFNFFTMIHSLLHKTIGHVFNILLSSTQNLEYFSYACPEPMITLGDRSQPRPLFSKKIQSSMTELNSFDQSLIRSI